MEQEWPAELRLENRVGERIWGGIINIKYLLKATQKPILLEIYTHVCA